MRLRLLCLAAILLLLGGLRPAMAEVMCASLPSEGSCCCPAADQPASDVDRMSRHCCCALEDAPIAPPPQASGLAASARDTVMERGDAVSQLSPVARATTSIGRPRRRPPPPRPTPIALHVRDLR